MSLASKESHVATLLPIPASPAQPRRVLNRPVANPFKIRPHQVPIRRARRAEPVPFDLGPEAGFLVDPIVARVILPHPRFQSRPIPALTHLADSAFGIAVRRRPPRRVVGRAEGLPAEAVDAVRDVRQRVRLRPVQVELAQGGVDAFLP